MTAPRGLPRRLARDLDRVLVGVGAAEGEEHAAAVEAGALEQLRRQPRARLGAPGVADEAQALGLRADRRDQLRMLVAEVAALGQAAHVEDPAAVGQLQARAPAADDGRRIPVGLDRTSCAAPSRVRRPSSGHHFVRYAHALCVLRTTLWSPYPRRQSVATGVRSQHGRRSAQRTAVRGQPRLRAVAGARAVGVARLRCPAHAAEPGRHRRAHRDVARRRAAPGDDPANTWATCAAAVANTC